MDRKQTKSRNQIKDISFRVAKAAVKAILFYLLYFLLTSMLSPLFGMIPGFSESIEAFVIVYIVLMILGDLTSKTVFQHFFNTTRSLFFIGYLILSMGDGMFSANYESFSLTVNFTLFYAIAATLSLLGFARTILQAINYVHEKSEATGNL